MKICKINFIGNIGQKLKAAPKPTLNYEIKDTVSFGKKRTQEQNTESIGANYSDMLQMVDLERTRTILEMRKAYRMGEDIKEDRDKLILSRVPKVISDAKKFTQEHPEFDVEDVEQDLIRIAVKATDSEITTTSDCLTYGPSFENRKQEYFEKILGRKTRDEKKLPQIERYLLIAQEETAPEEVHTRLEQAISDKELKEDIEKAVKRLKPRYQEIIRMHFGLDGNKPMQLTDIERTSSTTGENIRQIKERALKHLKKAYLDVIYEKMTQGKYDEY